MHAAFPVAKWAPGRGCRLPDANRRYAARSKPHYSSTINRARQFIAHSVQRMLNVLFLFAQ